MLFTAAASQGLIPIVGAAREPGTSMLIEDVACPVDKLDGMMIDLIDMFQVGAGGARMRLGHTLPSAAAAGMRFARVQVKTGAALHVKWARGSLLRPEVCVRVCCAALRLPRRVLLWPRARG